MESGRTSVSSFGGWRTRVGDLLPPSLAVPLRSRFGPSREAEMGLVAEFVSPGDTCVDVGANKGTWTQAMSSRVGPQGRVIAIEPQRALAAYLDQAFARSPQVSVRNAAVSDQPGTMQLCIPQEDGRPVRGHASLSRVVSEATYETVAVSTLDDVIGDACPSFMKIDVEGHELAVLRGARQFLERCRPTMVVEMTDYGASTATGACFEMLVADYGYQASYLEAGARVSLSQWPPISPLPTPNVVFTQASLST